MRVNRYSGDRSVVLPGLLFWLLALMFGLWLAWDAFFFHLVLYSPWADYWEHSAVLREWLRDFESPDNPHVASPDLSPRYMPYFWLLTRLGLAAGLDAIELLGLASVVNYALVVIGLRLFLNAYFRSPWAAPVGFIVLFMCWGVSYNWSNLYQLRSLFYVAAYPSTFVFGLSLVAWRVVLDVLRGTWSALAGAAFLVPVAALLFLVHPLTGVFGIGSAGLLALVQSGARPARRAGILGALAAGAVLAEAWPWFSVWQLVLGLYSPGDEQWFHTAEETGPMARLFSGVWMHIFYNPRLVLINLGPALLGLPLLAWFLFRREHLFLVAGAASMLLPYALHLFVEIPLAHRFLLFAVTFMQFAIVAAVLRVIDGRRSVPPLRGAGPALGVISVCAAALTAFNVWLLALEFTGKTLFSRTLTIIDKRAPLPEGMTTVDLYARLLEPVPDDAVVLTPARLGWPLPTVGAKVVSLYHENPMLLDQRSRAEATREFFYSDAPEARRLEIARKYAATHVLVSEADEYMHPGVGGWLAQHGQLVSQVDGYRMYRILDLRGSGGA